MRRECRERFPHHRLQRRPVVSSSGPGKPQFYVSGKGPKAKSSVCTGQTDMSILVSYNLIRQKQQTVDCKFGTWNVIRKWRIFKTELYARCFNPPAILVGMATQWSFFCELSLQGYNESYYISKPYSLISKPCWIYISNVINSMKIAWFLCVTTLSHNNLKRGWCDILLGA